MYELPTTLNIGGVDYKIRGDGDYRIVLDTFSILEDIELDKKERLLLALCVFYDDIDSIEDVAMFSSIEEAALKMFEFFDAGRPRSQAHSSAKLMDWQDDASMICAAVNKVAGQEIRAVPYLHWWTFISYYSSVGESVLATVLSIRDKMSKGKSLDKWENEYRKDNLCVRDYVVTFLGIPIFRAKFTSTNNQALRQLTILEESQLHIKGF
jgi:hypothetical protein